MNECISLAHPPLPTSIEERIRSYAFQLYVRNGHRNDRCAENWREAQQHIGAALAQDGGPLPPNEPAAAGPAPTTTTASAALARSDRPRIGIAADHGGYALKSHLLGLLRADGYVVTDFGAGRLNAADDYPDFIEPMAESVAAGTLDRGIGLCGSGVGACIAANKVKGVRACLIRDRFCAHQGVEDDHMNVMCLGGGVIGYGLAWELVQTFLAARGSSAERHLRRVAKVAALEGRPDQPRTDRGNGPLASPRESAEPGRVLTGPE
jgi:ribose 5-phosphate isomerase B